MEVHLDADMQAKLARMAVEQGRNTDALVQEAIARFVDYDEWFIREVEKGLASADRGELLSHEEVGTRLEKLIAERRALR
jgi:predicted transcriptional regulator